jgi:hypothetical protein
MDRENEKSLYAPLPSRFREMEGDIVAFGPVNVTLAVDKSIERRRP